MAAGFDETLRAGRSLMRLILSRSRRYGLGPNQPFLCFEFKDQRLLVTTQDGPMATLDAIELTPALMALVRALEQMPITDPWQDLS